MAAILTAGAVLPSGGGNTRSLRSSACRGLIRCHFCRRARHCRILSWRRWPSSARSARPRSGETLFHVGDQRFPFIAIVEGEVAILDPAGHEIVRHGKSKFLGELSLLSGRRRSCRPSPPSRCATSPSIATCCDRCSTRTAPSATSLLSTFIARREALQRVQDFGVEVVARARGSPRCGWSTSSRSNRLPFTGGTMTRRTGWIRRACPLVRLPGGPEMLAPSTGEVSRRSASAASSRRARRSTCSWSGPARPGSAPRCTGPQRASTRW